MSRKRKQKKGRLSTASSERENTSSLQSDGASNVSAGFSPEALPEKPFEGLAQDSNEKLTDSLPGESDFGARRAVPAGAGHLRTAATTPEVPPRSPEPPSSEQTRRAADALESLPETERMTAPKRLSEEQQESGGIIARLMRWWRGPSPVTVRIPSNPPGSMEAAELVSPPGVVPEQAPAPVSAHASGTPISGPSSAVSQVHAALMVERLQSELEETRRQLQQERESAQAKVLELERERIQLRQEAERLQKERDGIEAHTNVLRKSVAALERQLQEERETAAKNIEEYEARIRSFEESLKSSRAPVADLRAELEESRAQRDRLESLLERSRVELEVAQRQLREELDVAHGRIQQLESELSRKSGASDQAAAERARIEERASLVQKALEVMEQQLREEREESGRQIRQLEAELEQARAKAMQLETRVSTLIGELEKGKTRSQKKGSPEPEPEESTTLTTRTAGRIRALEKELASDTTPVPADRQTTTTRISRLESRWEELKSRLLPKDKEIVELRHRVGELQGQVEELETALAAARQEPGEPADASPKEEARGGLLPLSKESVEALYTQSMGKLTVLMASADILMMNPKLDAKVQESLREIKGQGQALLELIKSYTLPPESHSGH